MERSRLRELRSLLQERDHRNHSSNTWLAEVDTLSGTSTVALKDLDRSRMIPEFVAAEVAALLSLATPQSYLVEVSAGQRQGGKFRNGVADVASAGSTFFFGSDYKRLPVFDRGPPETQYGRLVQMSRSPSFAYIILFDALIGNVDRADRNILVDGDNLVPFDHDQAFLGLHWTPEILLQNLAKPNHSTFDAYLPWSNEPARAFMVQTAGEWSAKMGSKGNTVVAALPSELNMQADEKAAIAAFIDWRAENLADLISQRLKSQPIAG